MFSDGSLNAGDLESDEQMDISESDFPLNNISSFSSPYNGKNYVWVHESFKTPFFFIQLKTKTSNS